MKFEDVRNRNVVLFDLDGTLLPMDNLVFEKAYFKGLCGIITEVSTEKLVSAIWAGTKAMVLNNGSKTNREAFAEVFSNQSGIEYYSNEKRFMEFYRTDFQKCAEVCNITGKSKEIVNILHKKGYTTAIATNPVFPKIATDSRLKWLGITPEEFPLVTNFENSHSAKPNLEYYKEVCGKLKADPHDCIMIGNDVAEDGPAAELGMEVMLVTDCLINKKDLSLDSFATGTLDELLIWVKNLPTLKN